METLKQKKTNHTVTKFSYQKHRIGQRCKNVQFSHHKNGKSIIALVRTSWRMTVEKY